MEQVYADSRIRVTMLPSLGRFGNNAYLLEPAEGGPLTIIDLPEGAEAIVAAVNGRHVERVVVTHQHRDHWLGLDVVRAAIESPIYAGVDEPEIDDEQATHRLAHDDEFSVGDAMVRVIHTPGHTPGSICLYTDGIVITGDTLFPGGPGRTQTHALLQQEIRSITSRLHTLPEATLVLPGHGPTTTIGASRAEYAVFAAKTHAPDLHGDVLWLES